MAMGSVWLPIVFSLAMMAVCCGGPVLLEWWQRARSRRSPTPPAVESPMPASVDGSPGERVDG
jgi:hypothetical protein